MKLTSLVLAFVLFTRIETKSVDLATLVNVRFVLTNSLESFSDRNKAIIGDEEIFEETEYDNVEYVDNYVDTRTDLLSEQEKLVTKIVTPTIATTTTPTTSISINETTSPENRTNNPENLTAVTAAVPTSVPFPRLNKIKSITDASTIYTGFNIVGDHWLVVTTTPSSV